MQNLAAVATTLGLFGGLSDETIHLVLTHAHKDASNLVSRFFPDVTADRWFSLPTPPQDADQPCTLDYRPPYGAEIIRIVNRIRSGHLTQPPSYRR